MAMNLSSVKFVLCASKNIDSRIDIHQKFDLKASDAAFSFGVSCGDQAEIWCIVSTNTPNLANPAVLILHKLLKESP